MTAPSMHDARFHDAPRPAAPGTALITGARGRFGAHAVAAFRAAGWTVRVLLRPGAEGPEGVEVVSGDALSREDMIRAAAGADVIVQGAHPLYTDWAAQQPPMTAALLAAARASGASVLIPGNLYAYGPAMPEVLDERTPLKGASGKPLHRRRMEAQLQAAAEGRDGGAPVQVIQLKAGDFIDTRPGANWFEAVIAGKAAQGVVRWPGDRADLPHAFAYLPDFARAVEGLARARAALPNWAPLGFPGWTLTGEELCALIADATGREVARRRVPWWAMRLAAPVWPMGRELLEMRYIWNRPHRVDGMLLRARLPGFEATPPEEGIRRALAGLGQLPEGRAPLPRAGTTQAA